jgi:nitroreductase
MIATANAKEAATQHPVLDVIRRRWSARSFSQRPIDPATLDQLLEAATWASSSMNEQPWRYIYAHRSGSAFQSMVDCLLPGNKPWASNAAVLMLSLSKRNHDDGRPNRYHMHDTGAANMLLMLEAVNNGIYGHVMGGFDMEKTRAAFNISEDFEVVSVIALGYLDHAEKLAEPFRTREMTPRKRKSVNEIAHHQGMPKLNRHESN